MSDKFLIPINKYSNKLVKKDKYLWTIPDKTLGGLSYRAEGHIISSEIDNTSFWYLHRNKVIKSFISNYSQEWILDIGGGTGYVAKYLREHGNNLVILEPHPDGAEIAVKINKCQVINARLSECEFKTNSIPSVALFDVLEHFENDSELLRQCHSILSNDGKIFITVPAYSWLFSSFDTDAGHFRRYNQKSITTLLENNGFKVIDSTYFFWYLPLIIFLVRKTFLSRLLPRNAKSGHSKKSSALGFFASKMLAIELLLVRLRKKILFGSSLLIVAQK